MEYQQPSPKKGFPAWAIAVIGCGGCMFLILPILAAILFPVFAKAREAAKKASCQTNLHELATAMQMYVTDYGRLPSSVAGGSDLTFETRRTDPSGRATWASSVSNYTKNKDAFACPSDRMTTAGDASYYYKHAVNMAAKSGLKMSNFAFPSEQIVLYERQPFHWGGGSIYPGVSLNVAFLDSHVKTFRLKDVAPDAEPAYFNTVDSSNPKGAKLKKPYWDPRYCYDVFS